MLKLSLQYFLTVLLCRPNLQQFNSLISDTSKPGTSYALKMSQDFYDLLVKEVVMKKFTLISIPLCAVVLLLALTAGPALAGGPPPCAAITGLSDCVTVTFPGIPAFSFGFSELPGAEPAVLLPLPLPPIPGDPVVIAFTEPLTAPNGGQISDILFLVNNQLFFVSDDDPSALAAILAGLPGTPIFLEETGGVQDVSALLHQTTITVTVQSDVEAVPEPSTLLLLGSGFAGLAYWRRRLQA
jgi:hypothetical protein